LIIYGRFAAVIKTHEMSFKKVSADEEKNEIF